MKISENKLVTLLYKLSVKSEKGELELMEETSTEEPLKYFHGMGMMLPKFEQHLEGLTVGDEFDFMIDVEDAYGEYDNESIVDLPKDIFFIDGKFDDEKVFAGTIVPLVDNEGNHINAEVVEVMEDKVKVDFNHPLAGEALYFTGKILEVSQPTDEELHAMMHHSCGGGCSCGDGGCCGGDSDCGDGGCSCGGCC